MNSPSPRPAVELGRAASGCRVPGCHLAPAGPYFSKYRICRQHYSAAVLDLGLPELHRFCQQCSRTHPLSEFDGTKLSCRAGLARHTQRRKERMQRQADEPRKRRRLASECRAELQGGPQARLLPEAGAPAAGGAALRQPPPVPLSNSPVHAFQRPLAPSGPPLVLPVHPSALRPPPLALLPQRQLQAARLLGPAAKGGCVAASSSFLPPALGPLTPTPSEDPPCPPAAPALAHRRLQLHCALRLREQVQGLLQALQCQQGPASSPQGTTTRQSAQQPGMPVARGCGGAGRTLGLSLSAATRVGGSASHAQQAVPRASLPGASQGSAFRPWEAACP